MNTSETAAALIRAGKRAAVHLVQAAIEGLKAVEAVIDELAGLVDSNDGDRAKKRHKIEVE